MIPLILVILAGGLIQLGEMVPWWVHGLFVLPALLWAPGMGVARWFGRKEQTTRLQLVIDGAWLGMSFAWLAVAIGREFGLRGEEAVLFWWGTSLSITVIGQWVFRKETTPRHLPLREIIGVISVLASLLVLIGWRSADIVRPLDGYWFLNGADSVEQPSLNLQPGTGWETVESIGDPEFGAMRLVPSGDSASLVAPMGANGHTILAVRGPIGSRIRVGSEINTVGIAMVEHEFFSLRESLLSHEWDENALEEEDPDLLCERACSSALHRIHLRRVVRTTQCGLDVDTSTDESSAMVSCSGTATEGPVRRYLEEGVAGIRVPVNLDPGEEIDLELDGRSLYLFPGTESIWQAHASGDLRWVHYYQILNQVENQVWAREVLDSRRVTLNQPPGWSPLLAIATQVVDDDLPGANILFLWVLLLVGLTSVRVASLIAPGAPSSAWLVPAGMTLSHGFLMFEPMSVNFPDSLFAASFVGMAAALAGRRVGWFAFLGVWAQALRWPGGVLAILLAFAWWLVHRQPVRRALLLLGSGIGAGLCVILGLVWHAKACMDGRIEAGCTTADMPELADLGFILYFETFPEHWHGEYALEALLPRIPNFYGTWMAYTGGGLLIAAPLLLGKSNPARKALRAFFLCVVLYSAILCTIDHHPTHYFLPLIALTGPIVVAAAATGRQNVTRHLISTVCLFGLLIFLWIGRT